VIANARLDAHSSLAGYIVLAGLWAALGLFFTWIQYQKPESNSWQGAAICLGVAFTWVVWLRGFRLRVHDGVFEYRDGFYRTLRCQVAEIEDASTARVSWRLLGRSLRVPRMVISVRGAEPIRINVKPFSRADLATLRGILKTSHADAASKLARDQ
jgi:hypothetical protein